MIWQNKNIRVCFLTVLNIATTHTYIHKTQRNFMYLLMYIMKHLKWNRLASCGIMAIYFRALSQSAMWATHIQTTRPNGCCFTSWFIYRDSSQHPGRMVCMCFFFLFLSSIYPCMIFAVLAFNRRAIDREEGKQNSPQKTLIQYNTLCVYVCVYCVSFSSAKRAT